MPNVEVISLTWIICGAYLLKLSRRHCFCIVLTWKSCEDGMDYDIVLCLYVEVMKVTWMIHGAYMKKLSR